MVGDIVGNVLMGSNGADVLSGSGGKDLLIGAEIAQIIQGFTNTRGHSYLNPYSITDTQATVYGFVSISDDGAIDVLNGGNGDDVLLGGLGGDELNGGSGKDTASYTDSNTAVTVNLGTGTATGGTAEGDILNLIENIIGSTSGDVLTGNSKINSLRGHNGDDVLNGGGDSDTLMGEQGTDQLNGGKGADKLTGGSEGDAFIFDVAPLLDNADIITDFTVDVDSIYLNNSVFRAFKVEGLLATEAFVIGTAATTKFHRIIYNDTTGELFYDRDGTGTAGPLLFATLQSELQLEASDLKII